MKNTLLIIWLIILVTACRNKVQSQSSDLKKFIITKANVDLDNPISNGFIYHNNIILFLDNGKICVLDTTFHHNADAEKKWATIKNRFVKYKIYHNNIVLQLDSERISILDSSFNHRTLLETKLKKLKINAFFEKNDSLWFANAKTFYQLTGDSLSIIKKDKEFVNSHLIIWFDGPEYSDSLYNVYACGVGEFGGNVFFENKHTGKIFSLPTYFGQVVKFKNQYHLIEEYGWAAKFFTIENPEKLFLWKWNKKVFCCNCDSGSNLFHSVKLSKRKEFYTQLGVSNYFKTDSIQVLATFTLDTSLYSACFTDSNLIVIEHSNPLRVVNTVKRIDERPGFYQNAIVSQSDNKILCILYEKFWNYHSDETGENQTGFVLIRGNRIDYLERNEKGKIKSGN